MAGGAVSGSVRFLCHVPLFVLAIYGTSHYTYVKKHAQILLGPPYNKHKIWVAEGFSGPGVIVTFIWNFIFWIPTITASNKVLFYFGLVDVAIVSCLSYALYVESSFVGFTRSQCASIHANVTSDHHLLFFDRAGAVNVTDPGLGKSMCQSFQVKWYLALAITILYFFSAFSNLFAGLFFKDDYRHSRRHCQSNPIKTMAAWLVFPVVFIWKLLQTVLAPCFRWLPDNIQGRLRYSFRSIGRWTWYQTSSAASKVNPQNVHLPRYLQRSKSSDEKLAQMLLVSPNYDVLQLIAAKVHYVDLVNLSLVSKKIRGIVFPSLEDNSEDRQLRFHSCIGKGKSLCWTCGVQVCGGCRSDRKAVDSITSSHMRLCEARCSKCFHEILTRPRKERSSCNCYKRKIAPAHRYGPVRHVCQDCDKLNDKKLVALREKRDKSVYHRLTLQSLACAKCKELLPKTGLRWWVDTSCGKECRATCHPGYIDKADV